MLVAGSALSVGLALMLSVRFRAPEPAAQTVLTRTAAPEPPATGAAALEMLGVVLASRVLELTPRIEARVEAVLVRPGDRVARGQQVVALDVRALRQDLQVAASELRQAGSEHAQAAGQWRRRDALSHGLGAVSREELETARTQVQVATARIEGRKARVAQLEQALADAQLRAPFDGVVGICYATPGMAAGPGRPLLRLLAAGEPQVRFAVPLDRLGTLPRGTRIGVRTADGLDLPGVVESTTPEVDPGVRVATAVGKLAQIPGRLLWPGTVVHVRVIASHAAQ
jgi:RND family efflux transporter MFP subunit